MTEGLPKVRGIGEATLEKIEDYITISDWEAFQIR